MADDLDDILDSALDEVEQDDHDADAQSGKLSDAARAAAEASADAAKQAEGEAAKQAASGPDMSDAALSDILKELEDPEMAKTFEETMKMFQNNDTEAISKLLESGEVDEDLANTLKAMSEASSGVEGADSAQAEEMGEKIIAQMMKQFEDMGNKEDFQSMMDGMMQQLLSKDVMYPPIKQVCEKYPEWLADNEAKLDKEDYERYGKQYQFYQQLVGVYETEPDNVARISELLQEVQELGQPPADIISELAPGLEIGPDGMPKVPGMGPGALPPGLPPGLGGPPGDMDPDKLAESCAQQ